MLWIEPDPAGGPGGTAVDPGEARPGHPGAGESADEGAGRDPAGGTTAPTAAGPEVAGPSGRGRRALLVAGLTAAAALPLFVALAALRTPRWFPLLDLAMIEMRVRDVGTRHTPLIGLFGRFEWHGHQGNHPGPVSFWALAPVHRLLGGSAWSLMVGAVLLNTTAMALTVWVALRRGGTTLAVAVAAGLAVLVHLHGTNAATEPWTPYLAILWWGLTLLAVWAVLCGDLAVLPVAVLAASFCVQTHISYGPLVAAGAALVVGALAVRVVRLRHDPRDRPARRRLVAWSAAAVAVAAVLWLPPLVEQATTDPGNMTILAGYFRQPGEVALGLQGGAELAAVHLNPWRLVAGQAAMTGSALPGLVFVLAWAVAAIAAWRAMPAGTPGRADLVRLHVVAGVAVAAGVVAMSRIVGYVWFYLTLWAWTSTMLMGLAVVWTAALVLRARAPSLPVARAGLVAPAAVLAVWTGWSTLDARDARPTQPGFSAIVADFTAAAEPAIEAREGHDGRYLVTWTDGVNLGSTGFGLVNELDRLGYDVGALPPFANSITEHRVLDPEDATTELHISFGPDIGRWEARAGVDRLASVDPRSDEQVAANAAARATLVERLGAAGRDDLVAMVDSAPLTLRFDRDLPADLVDEVQVIVDTGQPAALFITER